MAKILYNEDACSGCQLCSQVCAGFWGFDEQRSKAILKEGTNVGEGKFERDIEEVSCNQDAADSCPTSAIEIQQ